MLKSFHGLMLHYMYIKFPNGKDFTYTTIPFCNKYRNSDLKMNSLLLKLCLYFRNKKHNHWVYTSCFSSVAAKIVSSKWILNMAVFWVVGPCSLVEVYQHSPR